MLFIKLEAWGFALELNPFVNCICITLVYDLGSYFLSFYNYFIYKNYWKICSRGSLTFDALHLRCLHLNRSKLLSLRCDSRLGRVNRSLRILSYGRNLDHIICLSYVIEILMHQSLLTGQSLSWIHFHESNHEWKSFLGKLSWVLLIQRFRFTYIWEFKANKSWIFIKAFKLFSGKWAQYFLY